MASILAKNESLELLCLPIADYDENLKLSDVGYIYFHPMTKAQLQLAEVAVHSVFLKRASAIADMVAESVKKDSTKQVKDLYDPDNFLLSEEFTDDLLEHYFNKQISHCENLTFPHPETGDEIEITKDVHEKHPELRIKKWYDIFPLYKKHEYIREVFFLHETPSNMLTKLLLESQEISLNELRSNLAKNLRKAYDKMKSNTGPTGSGTSGKKSNKPSSKRKQE